AEERGALRLRRAGPTDEPSAPTGRELPERRKRSILMIVAVLLLLVSAALLYSRLRSKPDPEIGPPATERSAPTPAAEAIPAPAAEASPALQVVPAHQAASPPALEAAPEAATEAAPGHAPGFDPEAAPATAPEAPHATTPSVESGGSELPPPARVSEAQTVLAISDDTGNAGGVTEIAKSSVPSVAQAEAMPMRQLASLRSDEGALPSDVSVTVGEATAATNMGSAKGVLQAVQSPYVGGPSRSGRRNLRPLKSMRRRSKIRGAPRLRPEQGFDYARPGAAEQTRL
ncbi:MAG: hypothetical protein WA441_04610, partial [Methyloceanibacter sp.]